MITPNSIAKAKEALDQLAPLIGRYVASLVESGLSRAGAITTRTVREKIEGNPIDPRPAWRVTR